MPYKQKEKRIEIECVWDCTLRQEKAELLCKQLGDLDHQESLSSELVLPDVWFRTYPWIFQFALASDLVYKLL